MIRARKTTQDACAARYYERNRDRFVAERRARYYRRKAMALCASCEGKSFAEWCRGCRSKRVVRRGEQGPDYALLATREIERIVGRPYEQFTREDHWSVTALLVKWAQSRGQLLDYDPMKEPINKSRRAR